MIHTGNANGYLENSGIQGGYLIFLDRENNCCNLFSVLLKQYPYLMVLKKPFT